MSEDTEQLNVIVLTDQKSGQQIVFKRSPDLDLISITPFEGGSKLKVRVHGAIETHAIRENPAEALAIFAKDAKLNRVAPPAEAVDLKKVLADDND